MHLIQIVRNYLGLSQQELASRVGITQPNLCEMEIKPPYRRIEKYERLSEYLGIPIHALVNNDCTLVPLSFFDKHDILLLMQKTPMKATRGSVVKVRRLFSIKKGNGCKKSIPAWQS